MDERTHEKISIQVSLYRELKAEVDTLKAQMDIIKADLVSTVELCGNWKDTKGYVRRVTRAPSASYPSKAMDVLAKAWSESEDPIARSCGHMLFQYRKVKAGSTYLQIK